jgi:hypothetical protein
MTEINSSGFLGARKGLNYVGNYAYAYSGGIELNNNTKTYLEFMSDDKLLLATVTLTGDFAYLDSSKRVRMKIALNDTVVSYSSYLFNNAAGFADLDSIPITIPPLTKVLVECTTNQTSGLVYYVLLNGKIKSLNK